MKNRTKKAARRPQEQRSPSRMTPTQRDNLAKGRHMKHLKMSRKAIADRNRQRARRQREKESSPAAVQARLEAQEQETFLRSGPPTRGVAKPSIIAAWYRAAKMTPQERRDAWAAQDERLTKAWDYPRGTKFGGILPADGSADPDDPNLGPVMVIKPDKVKRHPAQEPAEPTPDPDRDGLDVE